MSDITDMTIDEALGDIWRPGVHYVSQAEARIAVMKAEIERLRVEARSSSKSVEINTSVFTTQSVCDLRDATWDIVYRLEEWVGGRESRQDEKVLEKAKKALSKLVKS